MEINEALLRLFTLLVIEFEVRNISSLLHLSKVTLIKVLNSHIPQSSLHFSYSLTRGAGKINELHQQQRISQQQQAKQPTMHDIIYINIKVSTLQLVVNRKVLIGGFDFESIPYNQIDSLISMSEQRKNQIMQQFRRPQGNKSSRSKDIKNRLHQLRSKQTFLTDTQTSDYTKSSGEINSPRYEQLEQVIRKLQKENGELKQRIVELKANQFFQINQDKLKNIIKDSDKLRQQLDKLRKELQHSLVQRDFLQRFNKNLKVQCESLTKELLMLKGNSSTIQSKKNQRSIYLSRDDVDSNKSKNSSNDLQLPIKRKQGQTGWKKQKEQTNVNQQQNRNLLKTSLSASRLHEDYYPSRSSRYKALKITRQ